MRSFREDSGRNLNFLDPLLRLLHRGSNVNKQAVIINFAEDPTLLTSVIHIRWTKKAHRTSQQLVEFTFLIAWEQCVARFNRALGIEADDVSGNGCCLAPVAR